MKILSIGSDRNLFVENSEVRQRAIEYGKLFDELHIIVFSTKKLHVADYMLRVSDNVFLYPTNSRSRWCYIFDAYKIAKKVLGIGGQWVISAQDPFESGLAGYFIKKKYKIPLQLQIHTDFLSPYFGRDSILNRIRVLIAEFLIPRADCTRVVSERIKNSIVSKYRSIEISKIAVLPIFVDIQKIKDEPVKTDLHKKYSQFDFIILMASRLTKEKNIGVAIEEMAEIVKQNSKTGLIIVGDGPEAGAIKLQITNYKLQKNIILESWTDDLISYYRSADLFLLTSNYEGYGRTAVEAMAAGCPVVMTDVGLAGEFLKDRENGFVVPVADSIRLKEAVLELVANEDLRKKFAEKSKEILTGLPDKENYLKMYKENLCGF